MSATTSGAAGYPSGGAMRRWTRHAVRARSQTGVGEMFNDVYTALLSLVVTVAMVGAGVRAQGVARAGAPAPAGLDTGWIALLMAVAVLGTGIGLLARTGPVSLGAAQSVWWLPLPGERRSLLRPAVLVPTAAAGVVGAVTGGLLVLALDPDLTVGGVLSGAVAGLTLGAALALTLVAVEAAGLRGGAAVVGDAVLASAPVAALVLVVLPPSPLEVSGTWWPAAVGVVLLAATWWLADRRLERIHDTELRERGAATVELRGAALGMDTRALGRAVSTEPGRGRRRSSRLRTLPALTRILGPGAAIATADALLLRRSPRRVVQLVSGAALAMVAGLLPELPAVLAVIGIVAGAWLAALATAQGARHAEVVPTVDALLPLPERAVRAWRLVVPAAAMLVWSLPVFLVLGTTYADGAAWLALGVLAGPVWAAGAVRSAYRPPPDFSGPLIITPMGAFPPGLASVASKGPDVVLLGAIPLAIAVLSGIVSPVLLAVQVGLSALAVVLAVRPVEPPKAP